MVNEWYGWAGTILRVGLTKEKIDKKPLTKELAYNFLGGRGFNAKVLWDEIKPGIDPLGPENVLCIGVGPLNGTAMPMSGRFNITCKSPLTGILGDGNAGGYWAPELKFAGYDQIVITGRSEKPVYLWINDDCVEIKDASHLWGKTTWESEKIIQEEHGKDVQVCGIGQAGENLVRASTTIANLFRSGSPGSGAVWGSKRLKAIVVKGTKGVKIADPEKFLELVEKDHEFLLKNEYIQGTIVGLGTPGYAPYWYWPQDARGLTAEEAKAKVGGEVLHEMYVSQLKGCFNCLAPCGRYYNINTGKYAGTRGKAPEAATIITMGFYCGNLNLASILKLNNLCNQYGLNTYPAGDAIQLAMRLYEKGVITKKDTDGLSLEWGNEEAQFELVHKMALREGFGNKLAEGPYVFAKIIGKGAENLYPHNYGYSRGSGYYGLPLGLLYMTSTRGADHLRGVSERYPPMLWKGRGLSKLNESAIIIGQHEWVLADCLERCKSAVNTWAIGCPLNYYIIRGWDLSSGIPTRKKLNKLNLEYVADEIESGSPYLDWRGPNLWSLDNYPHGGKRATIL
ncbi:MAG: aldehyde ferredoxin oxidoreductase family protein [Candidatus Ranarchaeia archaeon]|jgi:aldehyde:ferredoxin oxidoreductase